MIKDWKNNPVEPLTIFSTAIGDPALDWASREELTQLRYTREDLDSAIALKLRVEDLLPLADAYGSALSCRFLIGDQVILEVNDLINEEVLDRFRRAVDGSPSVSLYLKIDKTQLGLDWFGTAHLLPRLG